jgi:Ni/Fe-hydrogenase subunit HybB-like protein
MSAAPHVAAAPAGGRLITRTTCILALPVLAMLAVLAVRFVHGIGAVTNLNDGYPWGLWIAYDVVSGSALGAGGFATALLVYVLNRGRYHPLVRPALLAALFGYLQAGASVMFDLGRYWNAWHIVVPRYAQVGSVLFEVAVCIAAYTLVLVLELTPVVLERLGLERARRALGRGLFVIVAIGVVLPTMHQSSLGSLLVVYGSQIHPLYQTLLLPLLFLLSCLGMGFAAVAIEGSLTSVALRRPMERELLASLLQVGRVLIAIFLVVRAADLVVRGAWPHAFRATAPAAAFWVETALFAVPLVLLRTPAHRQRRQLVFLSACAMALAGVAYRLSAYLIAYDTGAGWRYFPSVGELTVTFGLIAFEALAIIVGVRLLPILPAARGAPGARS